jgi:hypothetical protein
MERIPTVDLDALETIPFLADKTLDVSPVPFDGEVLEAHADTHILIAAPRIPGLTINWFREHFGVDPSKEPCMYNQDWYLREDFAAKTELDGGWHLIRKSVLEEARAKQPDDIERALSGERFPSAITLTFTFFAWWFLHNETLWKHDFLWCSDRDHSGDWIYVGRYEDPAGVNKNGFNIHRHLALRPAYSAAPEVL